MSPEVDDEIGERSVIVRRQARALVPSPELDAELAALQRQRGITPRVETNPPPTF